jgi:hypothetical protein
MFASSVTAFYASFGATWTIFALSDGASSGSFTVGPAHRTA